MKKILFVCGGNTCRSPMAKIILEQMLKERGLEHQIVVDSAAIAAPTSPTATKYARQVIEELYGKDLLANHKSKSLGSVNPDDFHLVLTMIEKQKESLQVEEKYTLMEYAELEGIVSDPYGGDIELYRNCRDKIKDCLEQVIDKIIEF